MALHPNAEYEGECTGGSWIRSSNNNPGFQIFIRCKDGSTSYTIWLSGKDAQKAKDKAAKALRILGCTDADMKSSSFLNYSLPQKIIGLQLRFGTVEETYNERTIVKVIWIGAKRKESDANVAAEAAALFGGNGSSKTGPITPENPATDDDIPF